MDEMQKYLFDLNGYLVVEDVLSADQVTALNEIFARQEYPTDSSIFAYAGGVHRVRAFSPGDDLSSTSSVIQRSCPYCASGSETVFVSRDCTQSS